MGEKIVSNLRVPACAKIEKIISCPKHGVVGTTLLWNGNEITFFRTDFLDFSRVAWYFAENFSDTSYHEVVPDKVLESIQKNGGFFLSKYFLTRASGGRVMSCKGTAIKDINYEKAKSVAHSLDVPELESDLMYGVVYDVLGKWLIETGTLTEKEWFMSPTTEPEQQRLLTRDCGGWNLKELLGNIFDMEWTQEMFGDINYVVAREGIPNTDGEVQYPARMRYTYNPGIKNFKAKVRAFMYYL